MTTIENLAKAFIGESQARNRYTFYSSTARKEGYQQISEIFALTADNENEHAEWLMKMINNIDKSNKPIVVDAECPRIWGTTTENLQAAIAGEHYEESIMYPTFAKVADEEGLKDVATKLRAIIVAEKHHEERYQKLLKELQGKTLFKKEKKVLWVCRKCGYVYEGKEPPKKCPMCEHDQGYYQLKCEQY